jgi:hypothetical protein
LRAEAAGGGWQTLVSGGAFGLEGGLAVTAVLAAACAVAVLSSTKKSELTEDGAPFEP